MKILLSPAKALDFNKTLASNDSTAPIYMKEAQDLIKKLSRMSAKKIGDMMHLSKDLAELNHTRFQEWEPEVELNGKNAHAAAAFNGEVYRGLDATTMSADEVKRAQESIRILSGLYGILRPLDVVYPYRLEMGSKFAVTPSKPNLYKFWGSKIADVLNQEAQGEPIINLASGEYFKAVDLKKLKSPVFTANFKEFKDGDYKTIMVFAKKARGLMARYIIQNDIKNPEDIKGFDVDGYRFHEALSKENDWVFTR